MSGPGGPRSGRELDMDLEPQTRAQGLRRRSARLRAKEPLARDQSENLLRQALRPRRPHGVAAGARPPGLARLHLAEEVRRPGLGRDAALPVRERAGRGGRAAHHPVRPEDGRAGDLHLRQRRAEGALPARHPRIDRVVVPGLFRAGRRLRSRQPAHQGGARHDQGATTTSSTARRPGPRSPIGATGSSAWCAPIPTPSRRRASPSC